MKRLVLLMITVFLAQGLAYHQALGQGNPGAILQQQRKTFEYNRWRQQFEQIEKEKKESKSPVEVEQEAEGAIQTEQKETHDVNPPQEKEDEKE